MNKKCTVEDCNNKAMAKSLCNKHYQQARRKKNKQVKPCLQELPKLKFCPSCNEIFPRTTEYFHKNKSTRDGLSTYCKECARIRKREYDAKKRSDKRTIHTPNEIIIYKDYAEIVLYDRKGIEKARTKIDIEDIEKVKNYKWSLDTCGKGYAMSSRKKDGKAHKLQRLILGYEGDLYVDHINGDGLDNRKANLRIVTPQQNTMNRGTNSNNTSGATGVNFQKASNKWVAYITFNRKYTYLGSYDTFEEAVKARKEAEIKYFGEYRRK